MRPKRSTLICLLLAAAIAISPAVRRAGYAVFRWPLTAAERLCDVLLWLPSLSTLSREQADLRSAMAGQQLELIRLRELARHAGHADALKRQAPDATGPVASVIGRTIVPTQHLIFLNRGARQGVTASSIWLDVAGVVGRTVEVHRDTSVAMLLTDPDSRVAAVLERSRDSGLLVGTGGAVCQLLYLDLDADVQVGDRVLTAGFSNTFPKGLVLGTVSKVVRQPSQSTTAAWIIPAVRLSRLEEVLCLVAPSPSS